MNFLKWAQNGGHVPFKLAPWDRCGHSSFRFDPDPGGGGGGGDPPADPPNPADPNNVPQFSQVQINGMLADEKRKHKAEMQKHVESLEKLQKEKGLTEEHRTTLSKQISDLQDSLMTAEQKSDAEKLRLSKEHKDQLTAAEQKAEVNWGMYTETKKNVAISAAATKHGAYRMEQLSAIVAPKAELLAIKDSEDKVIDWNVVVRNVKHKDKDGKEVTADVSVEKYVEIMKANEDFANLFVSQKLGGTGYHPGSPSGGGTPGEHMSSTEKISAGLARRI